MAAHPSVTKIGNISLIPMTHGACPGFEVWSTSRELELGSVLCEPESGLWAACLAGGFQATPARFSTHLVALESLLRMTTPGTPPLYARMTLEQLEAEEKVINKHYPTLGPESSREIADRLLSRINAQKTMLLEAEFAETAARR